MMFRRAVSAASTAALTMFLTGLTAAPVSAAGGTLDLNMNNPPRISGDAWPGGTSVRICRGSQDLGVTQTDPFGSFAFPLDRSAHVGEKYTVSAGGTCAAPGAASMSVVASLAVPTVDVPTGWIYGSGGAEDATLTANVGNQYDGVLASDTVQPNPDGTWSAYLGPAVFDLMKGVGVGLHLQFPDGVSVSRNSAVANPIISIWDTHGVAARGWAPNTALHLSLTDPGAGESYEWTVTTDENGDFWDVPPDPQWQVLQPGWIASGTGSVQNREVSTMTKTLALPDPLPFPTSMAGNVAMGTVAGVLTTESVGAGSYIEATAVCRTNDWPQRAMQTGVSGAFTLDFTAAPTFPWDSGAACAQPTHYYGFDLRDLDGDELSVNWHVTPQPKVFAPDVVYNGQTGDVSGSGWDLMSLAISQCQVSGSNFLCDDSTTQVTNDNPDPLWDQYPNGYAQFEENIVFERYLSVGGGDPVDCAQAPGTCAVVVTEPNRVGIRAFAPLTFGFDPFVQLQPSENLEDGDTITVSGGDFPPNATFPFDMAQGYGSTQRGGLVDHDTWWMGSVTTDGTGSFSVDVEASRVLHVSPMPADPKLDVDCATVAAASENRCGVFAYWTPDHPGADTVQFFVPLTYQPPTGPAGPPGAPGATGPSGATGPAGPPGEAPLVAIFAPGKYSAKAGKKLKVPYALSAPSQLTAELVRKSTKLNKAVRGSAGANTLTWKLVGKGKKPLPAGKYRLSLSNPGGRTLTTIKVKVLR